MSLFDLVARLKLDTTDYDKEVEDAQGKASSLASKIGGGFGTAMKVVGSGIALTTAAMGKLGLDAVQVGQEFDKSMSQVAATMGVGVDEIGDLREFAMQMGATTAFSATQAAEALNYMALAGYDSEQAMQALPNVLNLAAAGGIDLAYASDMVTDAQSALGLSFEESSELIDKMAKASSRSNTSVSQLGEAILTVGGTAKNMSGGTTELAQVLGILADNGIKGAEGGTALRNIMLSLTAPTDQARQSMEELGLTVLDETGNVRSFEDIFSDLNKTLGTMASGQRTEVLNKIFNKVDLKSVNALLGTNVNRWHELTEAIDDSTGAAEEMAETQLDNLAGDITLFQSALEGARIAISDRLTPTLRTFVQFGTNGLTDISNAFHRGGLTEAADALGTFISDGITMITDKLPEFLDAGARLFVSLAEGMLQNIPQLVTAVVTAIGQLLATIGDHAPELIGAFVDAVLGAIEAITRPDVIGSLIQGAITLFLGLVEGINQAIPKIIEAIPTIIENIVSALTDPNNISALVEGAVQLFFGIIKAIPQIVVAILENMPQIIGAIVEGLVAGVGAVIEAAFTLFGGISTASEEVAQKTKEDAQATRDFIQTLQDIQPDLVNYNGLLSDQGHTLGELKNTHQEVQGKINEITANALKERRELTEEEIAQIKELKAQLKSLETESFSVYHNRQEAILTSAKRIESVTAEEAQQIIANAKDAAEKAKAAALEQYYGRLEAIENEKFATAEELEEMRTKAQQEYDAMVLTAEGYVSKTASALTDGAREWVSTQQGAWKEMNNGFKGFKESQLGEMVPFHERISGLFSAIGGDMNQSYKSGLDAIEMNSAAAWLNLIGESKKSGETLAAQDVEIVERMLEPFKDLPAELEGTGKETLDGLVEGLKDKVPALQDTSEMSAQEIVDAVESFLEINSPSRVMKRIGGYAIEGLIDGMDAKKSGIESTATSIASAMKTAADGQTSSYYNIGYNMAEGMRQGFLNQEYRLTSSVSNMISRVNYAARAKLDIHSPSRVWMRMGEQTGEGFDIGLQDSMGDAILGMRDMFDDMESFSPVMSAPEVQPQANTGRNYVEQVVININAADFDSIDDLADAVSQRMWEATEQKERSYA